MADQTSVFDPFSPDVAKIARQRAYAQLLQQQALTPQQGQMVSGHYISPGIGGALLPALAALMSGRMNAKADESQASAATAYQQAQGSALKDYMAKRNGTPATPDTPEVQGNNPSAYMPAQAGTPAVAGDPMAAATSAMMSRFPALQTIGKTDLDAQYKGQITPTALLTAPGTTAASRAAAVSGGGVGALRDEAKPIALDGTIQAFDPATATTKLAGKANYGAPGQIATDGAGHPIMGQVNTDTGEAKPFSSGTNVTLNTGEVSGKAFQDAIGKARSDSLVATKAGAENANKALINISDAQGALSAGIKSGSGADFKLGLAKVGKALGLSDDPTIVNTESYKSDIAHSVIAKIKALGTNPTDTDRAFINGMEGGTISADAGTLNHLLQIAKAEAGNALLQHQENLQANQNAPGVLPGDMNAMNVPFNFEAPELAYNKSTNRFSAPKFATPSTASAPASGPVDFNDYLRAHGLGGH